VGDHIMDPGQTLVTERVLCEPTAAPPHPAAALPRPPASADLKISG
jgi:hypothetical protein